MVGDLLQALVQDGLVTSILQPATFPELQAQVLLAFTQPPLILNGRVLGWMVETKIAVFVKACGVLMFSVVFGQMSLQQLIS